MFFLFFSLFIVVLVFWGIVGFYYCFLNDDDVGLYLFLGLFFVFLFVCFCFVFQNTTVMVIKAGTAVTILENVSHIATAFARVTREHIIVVEHVKVRVRVVYFINIINQT